MKLSLPAFQRDSRIDFARGLANWLMMLDHIPRDVASNMSLCTLGFSGATDIFCFASGYGVALLFGRMLVERGFVIAATRIFRRVGQLYGAYVVLFVAYITVISWVAENYGATDLFLQYHISGILDNPLQILKNGVLLRARPLNLDVLQLAIILLAAFPLILVALIRLPRVTVISSIGLYFLARHFNLGSPVGLPNGEIYLNPLCWQLLFVLGAYSAFYGEKLAIALKTHCSLRLLAVACIGLSLMLAIYGSVSPAINVLLNGPAGLIDRETLGPARVFHLLCAVALFNYSTSNGWLRFRSNLLQPVVICGDEWLACFCVGIFLSLTAHIILLTNPSTTALQLAVGLATLLIMISVAYYISWSRHQDQFSRGNPTRRSDTFAATEQ